MIPLCRDGLFDRSRRCLMRVNGNLGHLGCSVNPKRQLSLLTYFRFDIRFLPVVQASFENPKLAEVGLGIGLLLMPEEGGGVIVSKGFEGLGWVVADTVIQGVATAQKEDR